MGHEPRKTSGRVGRQAPALPALRGRRRIAPESAKSRTFSVALGRGKIRVAVVAESAPSKMGIARAPAPNTTRLGGRHASRVARALVAGIAVTLAPFIASAAGTGEAVSLTWNSPAGCPDRGAVLERLRSLLVVSKASGEQVTAQGTVVGGPPSG